MKISFYISLIILTTIFVEVVIEAYSLGALKICLTEVPGECNSEKECSENSEDDSEKNTFKLLEFQGKMQQMTLLNRQVNLNAKGHFREILSPPPEQI